MSFRFLASFHLFSTVIKREGEFSTQLQSASIYAPLSAFEQTLVSWSLFPFFFFFMVSLFSPSNV